MSSVTYMDLLYSAKSFLIYKYCLLYKVLICSYILYFHTCLCSETQYQTSEAPHNTSRLSHVDGPPHNTSRLSHVDGPPHNTSRLSHVDGPPQNTSRLSHVDGLNDFQSDFSVMVLATNGHLPPLVSCFSYA